VGAGVKSAVAAQGKMFESLGCIVEEAEPDFSDANECFVAWRHWSTELAFGDLIAAHGDQLNEYIHWHVEEGRKLTGPYLARVESEAHRFVPAHGGVHGQVRILRSARKSGAAV